MIDGFDNLQDLYQQVILDHGRKPRNFREIADADKQADGFNPLCGDQVTIFLKLDDDTIQDVAFNGKGCAICTASASMMTQALKGKTLDNAETLFEAFHDMTTTGEGEPDQQVLGKLAVFSGVRKYPVRVKCATLPWHTLRNSLAGADNVATTE